MRFSSTATWPSRATCHAAVGCWQATTEFLSFHRQLSARGHYKLDVWYRLKIECWSDNGLKFMIINTLQSGHMCLSMHRERCYPSTSVLVSENFTLKAKTVLLSGKIPFPGYCTLMLWKCPFVKSSSWLKSKRRITKWATLLCTQF